MTELEKELKMKEIDQLHSSILQFSKNTLSTKKVCATILVAVVASILKITDNVLDLSIYIAGIITIVVFWIVDANSYYYQRKLRIRMSSIVKPMKGIGVMDGFGMPLYSDSEKPSWFYSIFNWSQIFYILISVVLIIVAVLDCWGYF